MPRASSPMKGSVLASTKSTAAAIAYASVWSRLEGRSRKRRAPQRAHSARPPGGRAGSRCSRLHSGHAVKSLFVLGIYGISPMLDSLVPMDGPEIIARALSLARHSDSPQHYTRTYLTPAHQAAARQIEGWMREAGMAVRVDAVG